MKVEEPDDKFVSLDWPLGITDYGDRKALVRDKHYFEEEFRNKSLGSKHAAKVARIIITSLLVLCSQMQIFAGKVLFFWCVNIQSYISRTTIHTSYSKGTF